MKKIMLSLINGFVISGPKEREKEGRNLLNVVNKEMLSAYKDAKREGRSESAQMDERDDVFYQFEEEFEKLGFKLRNI